MRPRNSLINFSQIFEEFFKNLLTNAGRGRIMTHNKSQKEAIP